MHEVVIPGRFNGPPASAHGGYTCGILARLLGQAGAEVRLRHPPPLERPLAWDGAVLADGDTVVAEARAVAGTGPPDDLPPPVTAAEARAASRAFAGFGTHPFPGCFACGTARDEGDGLRIFPGTVPGRGAGHEVVAAPWVPGPSVAVGGAVPLEVTWAALDCVGIWSALGDIGGTYVLGTMRATVTGEAAVGETHVATGWLRGREGRKLWCGSALRAPTGALVGWSHQTWVRIA